MKKSAATDSAGTEPTAVEVRDVADGEVLQDADLPVGIGSLTLQALDALAVALAEHQHVWTPEEKALYESAVHNEKERQRVVSGAVGIASVTGISEAPERAVLERIATFEWGHDGRPNPLTRIIDSLLKMARDGLKA